MKNNPVQKHRAAALRGFTLTELLVVTLLIIVLAVLSMIGIQRIRMMADKTGSIRNLSQLQIANAVYAGDHNGRLVPVRANDDKGSPTRWFQDEKFLENLIGPMTNASGKQVTVIPLEMLDPKVVRARKFEHNRIFASYGMNDTGLKLGDEPNLNSAHNMNQITHPSRSMSFSTAIDFRVTYNSRLNWKLENQLDTRQAPGSVGAMAYRHNNKALVVYFDGHVGEVSQAQIKEFDAQGGKNNPFWNPTVR